MAADRMSADKVNAPIPEGREIATLAGGCFWCLETLFDRLKGVDKVVSGYSGGPTENPTYAEVCSGTTGHAEVIQITYDPDVISFKTLLEIFLTMHDPTTLNRQGADVGTQYRSAIFYHSDGQKKIADQVIKEFESEMIWMDPIVTEVGPFEKFYAAEDYHQDYYVQNSNEAYCRVVISPKVIKFREKYNSLIRDE